jgi:hypothetical protein
MNGRTRGSFTREASRGGGGVQSRGVHRLNEETREWATPQSIIQSIKLIKRSSNQAQPLTPNDQRGKACAINLNLRTRLTIISRLCLELLHKNKYE